jgi:hypothetical protein
MGSEYQPLSTVRSDRLIASLDLPNKPGIQMGINTGQITKMMNMGGIRRVLITESGGSRELSSGHVALQESEREAFSEVNSFTPGLNNEHRRDWAVVTIGFHSKAISQRILEESKCPTDLLSWTPYLNREVIKGIWQSGRQQLTKVSLRDYGYLMVNALSAGLISSVGREDFLSVLSTFALINGMGAMVDQAYGVSKYGSENSSSGYRFSLTSGIQLDRLLILKAMGYIYRNSIFRPIPC